MGHEMSDKTAAMSGQLCADLVIVGGGIMGLWAALKAERRGIDTILIEAARTGSGASGGLLGALMAHMPDRWNEKKQLQFDGLLSLEARSRRSRRRRVCPPDIAAADG